MNQIVLDDNLRAMAGLADGCANLVYMDPPFNTGHRQGRTRIKTVRDADGDRTGFGGHRYRSQTVGRLGFADAFDDFLGFLAPRLEEARRLLAADGSLFVHLDPHESHYVKVFLDGLFSRRAFLGEIIWAYDFGGRSKRRWPAKHDTILWYVRDPERYTFDYEAIDRIPYLAPALVGPVKAARGKSPTDVWWQTVVPTNGRERTGYPTQKPLPILERIVRVHSRPGDLCLDPFAGSGTLGEAAGKLGRRFWLCDENPEATSIMMTRLARFEPLLLQGTAQRGAGPASTAEQGWDGDPDPR